jgi:hypothetical protein
MFEDIIGGSAWHILTEVGWQVVEGVMEYLKKFHPIMHLKDEDIQTFASEGDTLFNQEFCLPIMKGSSLTWRARYSKPFIHA